MLIFISTPSLCQVTYTVSYTLLYACPQHIQVERPNQPRCSDMATNWPSSIPNTPLSIIHKIAILFVTIVKCFFMKLSCALSVSYNCHYGTCSLRPTYICAYLSMSSFALMFWMHVKLKSYLSYYWFNYNYYYYCDYLNSFWFYCLSVYDVVMTISLSLSFHLARTKTSMPCFSIVESS